MSTQHNPPEMQLPQPAVLAGGGRVICFDPETIERYRVGTTPDGLPILTPPQTPPQSRGGAVDITSWVY